MKIIKRLIKAFCLSKLKDKVKFILDIGKYKRLYKRTIRNNFFIKTKNLYPCLKDYRLSSGVTKGDYFFQDLIVAKRIFESGVTEHFDIGSRIDGFIAHISVFLKKVIVLDIRPNTDKLFNIEFKQQDATNLIDISDNSIESISSLHAIEHFGLGRYGDPVDPQADIKAMMSLKRVLRSGGTLYFSVPIGYERLEFNGHRIYSPKTIMEYFNGLYLKEFIAIDTEGELRKDLTLKDNDTINKWTKGYGVGIFVFTK